MAKLRDAIHAVPPSGTGQPCKVMTVREQLDPEDQLEFDEFMSTTISATRLSMALAHLGVKLSATLINEHRGKMCRCFRSAAAA